METSFSISLWAVLIGLGAFHSLFLALVLFMKKENTVANNYFALLLLSVGITLLEYVIAIGRLYVHIPHVIATSYPFNFLIGPFYFFYIRKLLNGSFKFPAIQWLHFLPALLCLLLFLPFYLQDSDSKLAFLGTLAQSQDGNIDIPAGQYIFMGSHLIQMTIYVLLSYGMIKRKDSEFRNRLSDASIINLSILKRMTFLLILFLALFLAVLLYIIFVRAHRVEMDYFLVLVLTLLVHTAAYIALQQPHFFTEPTITTVKEKYATYKLTKNQSEEIFKKIYDIVDQKELYLNSDYKLSDLAGVMDLPSHYISQIINESGKANFFEFINAFRIQKAKGMLASSEYHNYKILAIAFDSGFNNKATFNRIFKKETGYTPSTYREKFTS